MMEGVCTRLAADAPNDFGQRSEHGRSYICPGPHSKEILESAKGHQQ